MLQPRPRDPDIAWFLVGLARQKRNYSLYINATNDDGYLAHAYADQLGNVKLGAASIGFTALAKVNLDALRDLLETAHHTTAADSW
jgi:hypothetical protein